MGVVGTATVTPGSMLLSPSRVTFNGVDLGGTKDNVVINWETTKSDILADQTGVTVRDRRNSGMLVTVTTAIAELQNLDTLSAMFPNARDTTVSLDRVLDFLLAVGCADLGLAKILTLHPLELDNADETFDLTFDLASPNESSELSLSPTDQGTLNIIWNIYPDSAGDATNKMFRIGPAATVVP